MTSEWLAFYTTLTQISVGLAGLLFISFSIYFAAFTNEIDPLETKIGTSYYLEVISAFVISLLAIMPPHWWWLGAAGVSIYYIYYIIGFTNFLREYREDFYRIYDRNSKKKAEGAETTKRAEIYKIYKLQCEDNWIFGIRSILLLLCSIGGVLSTFGIRITFFIFAHKFNSDDTAVQIAGLLSALYLGSSIIGAWIFFLNFEKRNKSNEKLELGKSKLELEKQIRSKTKPSRKT